MNSPQLRALYQLDATALLYSNVHSGLFMHVLAAAFLVFGFHNPELYQQKLLWFIILTIVVLARAIDVMLWRKQKCRAPLRGPSTLFCCGVMATALLWCFYTLAFFDGANIYEGFTMMVIVFIMASGASTALSARKMALFFFPIVLTVPFSIKLLLSGNNAYIMIGIVGIAFCAATILSSLRSHRFTMEAIQLKNQNKELLIDMESQIQQRTQQIYELSNIDPLTGLFNRSAFLAQFNVAISQKYDRHCAPLALLFMDLDRFKDINDNIGHRVGDTILVQVAKRLKEECYDAISICRWGGDEFLVVLPYRDISQLTSRVERLPDVIARPYCVNDGELNISASLGVALFPQHGLSAEELIQHADIAMYHRKKSDPGGAAFYNFALAQKLSREVYLRNRLSQAIEHDELYLTYQPLVSTIDDKPVALEALLRWRTNDELVSPVEFIPIAEQNGLIKSIGTWVLEQAFIAAAELNRRFPGITMGVNVSLIQFEDEHFTQIVENLLAKTGAQPEYINLEITESAFSLEKQLLLEKIQQLQSKGFVISIDDFGTGYSSLASVLDLSVSSIKIDKSFVDSLETKGAIIIEAVLGIAESLGQRVVAEGVEHQWQADQLKQMGVHLIQGFLYAKPMEWKPLLAFLQTHR